MEPPVDLGALEFLVLFGEIEGQLFLTVLQPLIRAFVQQQFHDLGILRLRCRLVEWRISCLVPRVRIGFTLTYQDRYYFRPYVLSRRNM